jgi:hypothetical protein
VGVVSADTGLALAALGLAATFRCETDATFDVGDERTGLGKSSGTTARTLATGEPIGLGMDDSKPFFLGIRRLTPAGEPGPEESGDAAAAITTAPAGGLAGLELRASASGMGRCVGLLRGGDGTGGGGEGVRIVLMAPRQRFA